MSSLSVVDVFVPDCWVFVALVLWFLGSKVFQWQVLCTLSVSPERTFLSRAVSLACDLCHLCLLLTFLFRYVV